jgi:hypothetical protein
MKHITHPQASDPMDVYAMMGMQAPPFDYAAKACQAWLDGAQSMQTEATNFVTARAGKDMAVLSELSRCKTPTDALEMQARYASEAMSDYAAGSRRMFELLTAAAQRGVGAGK